MRDDAFGPIDTTDSLALSIGVPGAVVPIAGVSGDKDGLLQAVAEAGDESIAGLWPWNPALHRDRGYGRATWRCHARVRGRAPFSSAINTTTATRVEAAEGIRLAEVIVNAIAETTPGAVRPMPGKWDTADEWLVTDGGFARHRPGPDRTLVLTELLATTPQAYATVWRHLLDRQGITEVTSDLRPLHDPLLGLLAEPRDSTYTLDDGLWLRIIDVKKALQERVFSAPLDISIQVHDPVLTHNNGTWRVRVDGLGAASIEATSTAADLELDISSLGGAHLGSTNLQTLAASGLIAEHSPGALRAAARSWAWDVPAACLDAF